MNHPGAPVICFTRDDELARRLQTVSRPECDLRVANSLEALFRFAREGAASVTLIDLRASAQGVDLADIVKQLPDHVVIALGAPRSDPVLRAAALPLYAVEPLPLDDSHMRSTLLQAVNHLNILEENRLLRQRQLRRRAEADHDPATLSHDARPPPLSVRDLFRIFRSMGDLDRMLDQLVEELAGSLQFSRAGIVIRETSNDDYELRAGWLLLEETRSVRFAAGDPFVRWLAHRAHLVDYAGLDHIRDPADSIMVRRMLERLGAQVIVPLRARGGLLGWLFVGHHITGNPLDQQKMQELGAVGDLVTASLENALLYREITIQKKKAESLLDALPTGIVFVDSNGRIQWFSMAAAGILGMPAADVIRQPVERLGPRLADISHRTMATGPADQPVEWTDPSTRRPLQVSAHRLIEGDDCLGVLLIVSDLTARRAIEEKQARLERAAFWNELSASMSHEIRNPLVAIKTFAQLLPERYGDPEFREEFSRMVDQEVNRLNGIIDQINGFAQFREIKLKGIDIRRPLRQALATVLETHGKDQGLNVDRRFADHLPNVAADETAMRECFQHLLTNALEALAHRTDPVLQISIESSTEGHERMVMIHIADNGHGIKSSMIDKVFSPFCTTKARGMGLGLPIVQRTVADHDGQLKFHSGKQGTTVSVLLPALADDGEERVS